MKKNVLLFTCLFLLVLQGSSQVLTGGNAVTTAASANGIPVYNAYATWRAGGNLGSGPDQLNEPNSVVADHAGNIYIADLNNHRIIKCLNGSVKGIVVAGGNSPGNAANQLNHPTDMRLDAAGNMYIADASNHRIQKWAPGAASATTVAGGNGAGSGANQLNYPSGIFIDAAGNVYVADYNNHRVQKWAPGASTGITVAGGNGNGTAANQIGFPNDVFVDAGGNIYVTDQTDARIQKWAPGANSGVTVAGGNGNGNAANQLAVPTGVYLDSAGNIFIADFGNNRVQAWSPGATSGITVAGNMPYEPNGNFLSGPVNVFIDAAGSLYVSDAYNNRILQFTIMPPGSSVRGTLVAGGHDYGPAANQLAYPTGVYVDAAGNILIADILNDRVQKWAPGATEGVTVAGGHGRGPAANQVSPADIAVDAAGNIYIADQYNNRVQKWAPGATSGTTVAGGNGEGSAANQLYQPLDVFVDAAGNVYVCDNGNGRIQKWAPGATSGITVARTLNVGLNSLFVDAAGNIYSGGSTAVDNAMVLKFTPGNLTGTIVAGGNLRGSGANQLLYPRGIFVDPAGNLYITDEGNSRIQKWAPGATSGVTVAGGIVQGGAPNQLSAPYDVFVDAAGNIYVPDLRTSSVLKFAPSNPDPAICPVNQTVAAPSCNTRVNISWTEPRDSFPASISISKGIHLTAASLILKGTFNGHAYYQSDDEYAWADARDAALGAGAHLVTITSDAENNFIFNNLNQRNNYAWIGLYNTGQKGSFAWVTGEPVNYTNWIPGEPDNLYGMNNPGTTIFEPYVHINGWADALCRWNDIGSGLNARFIAEIDNTAHSYRHISGPANGSTQLPGVYNICYERTNNTTLQKDTCCFSIKVTCNAVVAGQLRTAPSIKDIGNSLQVQALPNPSNSFFSLRLSGGGYGEKASVQITDLAGRVLEIKNGLAPDQTLQVGKSLKPGVYLIKVMQGERKRLIKVIRQ